MRRHAGIAGGGRAAHTATPRADLSTVQGIIIAGGDGLVHEVVTGYFQHPDQEGIHKIPVGITPSGTANAMAHALHRHDVRGRVWRVASGGRGVFLVVAAAVTFFGP